MVLIYELFITFVPKLLMTTMNFRQNMFFLTLLAGTLSASAQRSVTKTAPLVKEYTDSLSAARQRIDSTAYDSQDSRFSMLFTPLAFYHSPANHSLRLNPSGLGDGLGTEIDNTLLHVYLSRPDLVKTDESRLRSVGAPLDVPDKPRQNHPDLVEQVAPEVIEPDAAPMDILVMKPNFWTFAGDYYLQFLQNFVTDNWYKGGESSYSLLGSAVMQFNYNNKQKLKWENKLEMKLGYQTSRSDSVHSVKTSEDLLRLTSKLGLQAVNKWYYTLQMIAQTQFTKGYKSNDVLTYSDFFSPFTLNLSLGMDYKMDWLNHTLKGSIQLAPIAYNWKYVGRLDLSTRYGLDEGKHTKGDFGSECTVDFEWKIADNLKWKTRLYGYTTYDRAEVEWENTFTFQFNRFISTNVFIYPRFDDSVARDEHNGYWQFKEYASVGFAYSF